MLIPTTQKNLLKDILEDFEHEAILDDRTLGQIYHYLFGVGAKISFSDPVLVDTVLTLKDIVEMERLTTLESIISFFEAEDRAIDDCVADIKAEVEAMKQSTYTEEDECYADGVIYLLETAVAVRPALSRYVVTSDQFKHQHFVEVYVNMTCMLEEFFAMRLKAINIDKRALVDDLIQETVMKAWENYRQPMYAKYDVERLIWLKAKNALTEAYVKIEKNKIMVSLDQVIAEPSFYLVEMAFEARDMLAFVEQNSSSLEYLIFRRLQEGFTYREISHGLGISATTIRAKFHYFKKRLRQLILKESTQ